jgi:HSP90 family molecular chaperone
MSLIGIEVLYVSEPIDEMALQNIEKFQDKEIADAGKEASAQDLNDDEKKEKSKLETDSLDFRTWMKDVLGKCSQFPPLERIIVALTLMDL